MTVPPHAAWWAITVDCNEPHRVAEFWAALFDCPVLLTAPWIVSRRSSAGVHRDPLVG